MSHTKKLVTARDRIRAREDRLQKKGAAFISDGNNNAADACLCEAKGLKSAAAIIESLMRD